MAVCQGDTPSLARNGIDVQACVIVARHARGVQAATPLAPQLILARAAVGGIAVVRGHEDRAVAPVRVLQSCGVGHLAVPVGALNVHGHGVVLCKQYARIVDLAQRFERHVHRRVVLAAVSIVLAALRAAAGKKCRDTKRANACFLPVFHLGFLLIWVRTYARVLKLLMVLFQRHDVDRRTLAARVDAVVEVDGLGQLLSA